uniref:tissue factor-like n=1 Tax=Semicossyphus pulcher TaxID=241346 RepID=UPI0037E83FC5
MASVKTLFYLGVCLSAGTITTADKIYKAENVRWTSLDFKTMLTWTSKEPHHTYTVRYYMGENDWEDHPHCNQVNWLKCDMTNELNARDRSYTADVLSDTGNLGDDIEEFHHTQSNPFNPYKESNISAVVFSVKAVNESTVIVNITDTLTSVHVGAKQQTIRDIFKKDLKYKISYYKSGSTRQREHISDSSVAEVSELDAGQSYCFIVAAFIPSRPKATQQGEWSRQLCAQTYGDMQELSLGAWVGVIFILLTALIIIVTVTVLCCRNRQQRNKTLQTSQSSAVV